MQSPDTFSPRPVPLTAVLTTAELSRRPPRAADFQAENRALAELAQTLGSSRHSFLQKLAEVALELCGAHSAGVTLLEDLDAEPVLRWKALSGKLAGRLGSTLPRGFSPCRTTLDTDAIQLMQRPARHFRHIQAWEPEIQEALLIPFRLNGAPHGTLWVVAHDDQRRFDAEDARLLTSLSTFAGVAYEVLAEVQALQAEVVGARKRANLAKAADARRDRFNAILAHELRNLLAPTKNAAELLKKEALDAPTRARMAEIIERQVSGMSRLIDELLDIARLRGGNIDVRRTRISVAEIIKLTVEAVRPLVAGRDHTLVVSTPPERLFVDCDVLWLSQALHNLVGNAVKYTNQSGVIGITAERKEDEVVITVTDNGIGIAPDQLEKIFEPYAQAGQSGTTRSAGGLGLGLHIARLIIEAHGGLVRANSAGVGCGSDFVVHLPCASAGTDGALPGPTHI